MKGDPAIIGHLNAILTNELTAIHQYFLHARMLKHWGLDRIAQFVHDEALGEIGHADKLTERILFLDGVPNYQDLHAVTAGVDLPEVLTSDLGIETLNRTGLLAAIGACESVRDYDSRRVFEEILADTEEHIDWLETQLQLIQRIGLKAYEQEQINGPT